MSKPGVLYVCMRPNEGLSLDQFHDWYNNEHGPTRLRLPHIFTNGFRYRATDGLDPPFLAIYDVKHMPDLLTPVYTNLRDNRSEREAETIGQVQVDRRFYDLVGTKAAPDFTPIEEKSDKEAEGVVLVAAEITLKKIDGAEAAYSEWLLGEHADMLSRVPGWRRTRLFRTSGIQEAGETKVLALHDYAKENGLGGPDHLAAMGTSQRNEIFAKYVQDKKRRTFSLFRVFGSGPTDLSSLSKRPKEAQWVSSGSKETAALTTTITTPGPDASISSHIQAPDGLTIPYFLEGNPAPDAPVVAFSNSLLTSKHMWDPFVALLKKDRPDLKILRYDTRGRHAIPHPPQPATLELLSDDIKHLLDSLRITKLRALIGVSMGGATTLRFALDKPEYLEKFIACDFNATSSAANTQAWNDRIAMAESDGGKGIEQLAKVTVERWFHPETGAEVSDWMTRMVAENHVEGFRYGCQALWDYDLKPAMGGCTVPGLFVVGEADGKGALVKAMEGFSGLLKGGCGLRIVPRAGHLPMAENPEGFWEAVKDFI
ncbi:hypothetical protein VUR80DRAFT_9065 [Thermomyces stellatus]